MSSSEIRAPNEELDIEKLQVIDEDGQLRDDVEEPDLSDDELVDMYRYMMMGRYATERAETLHKQGYGLYPTTGGQEAIVGTAYALEKDEDWMYPAYREWPCTLVHGYPLERFIEYWAGHERGNAVPEDVNVFPYSVSIAVHIMHAVGAAWADKIRGTEDGAHICYFSDGATSQGVTHEAMNFAGVYDTANIFMCMNNQYAISVPFEQQSASRTIAQRAEAYDMKGLLVDGMDPLAVYEATKRAVQRIDDPPDDDRNRATLIEALQFRYGAHSVIDDDKAYRTEYEFEVQDEWKEKDPLTRTETFLRDRGLLDDESKAAIRAEVEEEWDSTFEAVHTGDSPDPNEIFEHVFEDLPWNVREHQEWLAELREELGDEVLLQASARSWEDDFMQGE